MTTSGSETVVLSEDKLGKLNLDVVNAEVYDSVYYVHKTDLTTLVLDLRFTPTYYDLNLGVSRLVKAEDTFYGYTGGKLFSLFKSENNLALTYKSPELVEQEYTNLKTYKSIYVSSAGNLEINIYRDNKLIKTKNLSGVTTHEIKVPQTEQQGYTLQFDISGTGIVKEIAYNALGRQK